MTITNLFLASGIACSHRALEQPHMATKEIFRKCVTRNQQSNPQHTYQER